MKKRLHMFEKQNSRVIYPAHNLTSTKIHQAQHSWLLQDIACGIFEFCDTDIPIISHACNFQTEIFKPL